MIFHGCEHVTERHGNRLFRNDVNYPRESTNTQKNPSRIIIIINDIHNIVIFEELKKILKKREKTLVHVPKIMSANAYVTGVRTCDICDVISLQHETEAVYILSFLYSVKKRQIVSFLCFFRKKVSIYLQLCLPEVLFQPCLFFEDQSQGCSLLH